MKHAEYCNRHDRSCAICKGPVTCISCRIHGGTYLWQLRCEGCRINFSHSAYKYLLESASYDPPKYNVLSHEFTTPRGNLAQMFYRENTNDWNTITASMTEDEYNLASLPKLSGAAIDIGAYIGSVAIGLALDNPDLRVFCIEPVPGNAELIRQNIEINKVRDRVTVIEAAAGGPTDTETIVDWGYIGEPHLEHHAFVGNTGLVYEYGSNPTYQHQTTVARCYSLTSLLKEAGVNRLDLLKIDCEGCEWCVLSDPATDRIDIIVGEWHNMAINVPSRPDLRIPCPETISRLLPNHNIEFSGPELGPGEFFAIHR